MRERAAVRVRELPVPLFLRSCHRPLCALCTRCDVFAHARICMLCSVLLCVLQPPLPFPIWLPLLVAAVVPLRPPLLVRTAWGRMPTATGRCCPPCPSTPSGPATAASSRRRARALRQRSRTRRQDGRIRPHDSGCFRSCSHRYREKHTEHTADRQWEKKHTEQQAEGGANRKVRG